ncbi:MAG: MFS transporter, partial [Firmicutes bacterium]|nr:MFS transporter [Bacillota bacterium]
MSTIKSTTPAGAPHKGYIILIAVIAAFGSLLFGYDTGVISGAILFLKTAFHLSPVIEEIVVSIVLAGAVVGAAAGGFLTDRYGRKRIIIGAAGLFMLSALLTALAPNLTVLITGRVLVGIAIGIASFTSPLYISEVAPAKIRGALVSFSQLALTVGIVVAYLVDYALSAHADWRAMFAIAVVPALILLIGMLFLPESPRWLLKEGRMVQAMRALTRIIGAAAAQEVKNIQKSLLQER